MWKVPLFDVNFDEREAQAVYDVVKSGWISMGGKTRELEKKFAELVGSKYAIAVSSCTAALHLAMLALGLHEGDEVIVPSLTFVATVNAVRYVGATPVFADIVSEEDLTIDPQDIERKITDKTKAIVVMHYAGFPVDMNRIMEIANKYGLYVVEDAAHAPLSYLNGKHLGTFGDIGAFSFFSNKNMTTAEGGMVVTDNEEFAEKVRLLRSHGMTTLSFDRYKGHASSYDVVVLGYNYRLDDIRAALGLVQLEKLEDGVNRRRKLVEKYRELLADDKRIVVPFAGKDALSSHYIFVVVIKGIDSARRNQIRTLLADRYKIQTSVHYPPVHKFSIYREFTTSLPKTERVSDSLITLPLYDNMSFEDVEYVISSLKRVLDEVV